MWRYRGTIIKDIVDMPDGVIGFIYMIKCKYGPNKGKIYIGKKQVISDTKKRIGKKEKVETKTRKTFKRIIKESNWKDYYGSCKPLLAEIKVNGKDNYKREILEYCYTKKYLSYCELYWQIKFDVLDSDSYNENILSRYFLKDIEDNKRIRDGRN